MTKSKTLCVIAGPTGSGKTECAIDVAEHFSIPVISADSRQIYKGISIGTAAPTEQQMQRARHFFVGIKELGESYSAGAFELDALTLLEGLFKESPLALMAGGSMMYIDAVCRGLDPVPAADPEVRESVMAMYREEGLDRLRSMLRLLDPESYRRVDLKNPKRVIHAVEVCLQTGRPYSEILSGEAKERPFNILKIGIAAPREEMYERINRRTDDMIARGLEDEARRVYPLRSLNSLNTVGYKEWFGFFDGQIESRERVAELIKRNTRHYAKKQLTWFKKDASMRWFAPGESGAIIDYIKQQTQWKTNPGSTS